MKTRLLSTLIVLFLFATKTISQSLMIEAGPANVASRSGFDGQLTINRYVSKNFGILGNITSGFSDTNTGENTAQIGFTTGAFMKIIESDNHLLLTEAAIGSSYYDLKQQTFLSFYWSADYFYKLTPKHYLGLSLGVNGGDHAMQYFNFSYHYNMYSKERAYGSGSNSFQLMSETTFEIGNNSVAPEINLIGSMDISKVVSIGIGSGFAYHTDNVIGIPLFVDFRLTLYDGLISPYSVFRLGYNFYEAGLAHGFGDIGLGACVNINENNGIYIDGKLRKSYAVEELDNQHAILSIGYKHSF